MQIPKPVHRVSCNLLGGVALISAAILMGVPLPAGNTFLGSRGAAFVAWAWAINGMTSVLGAALAVYLAINWGFTRVTLAGAAAYAVALAAWVWSHRHSTRVRNQNG
jgi:hypothetical protein